MKRRSVTIERVQRRATRLISTLKDLSYSERLEKLDLPTLKYRRFKGDLIQVYKIINKIDDLKVDTFSAPAKLYITRNAKCKLYVEYSKTNVTKFTFSNRIALAWNALSLIPKSAPNINKLKTLENRDSNLLVNKFDCDYFLKENCSMHMQT